MFALPLIQRGSPSAEALNFPGETRENKKPPSEEVRLPSDGGRFLLECSIASAVENISLGICDFDPGFI